MVDFGDTIFEGKLGSSVPIVQPVDDRSGETFASGLANSLNNFNSMMFSPERAKAGADRAKGLLFAEIGETINLYSDAREQGLSQDEILRNLRVKQNEWVSNYPELADDIFSFTNKALSENGLASNINRETPIESGNRKRIEAAQADGWNVSTPQGMAAYERYESTKLQLSQVAQQIEMLGAEGKMVSAQVKAQAVGSLHALINQGVPWVNDQINTAYSLLQSETDPVRRQAIIDQTKNTVLQQTALIGQLRSQVGGDVDASYLTKSIEDLMAQFDETASGKSSLEALTRQQGIVTAQTEAMIMTSNPQLASWIVMDKASRFTDPQAIRALDTLKMDALARLSQPTTMDQNGQVIGTKPPDIIDTVENTAAVFEALKQQTANILADPTAPAEAKEAQSGKIVQALLSVGKYGMTETDPRNFTAVVDFLADPTVGKFIEANPSPMYAQARDTARHVVEQQYSRVVLSLINDRWEQVSVTVINDRFGPRDNVKLDEAVIPVWNGAGIEFQIADEYKNNAIIRGMVQSLNQGNESVVAPLNKLIRMRAHLEGSTDYQKVYDEYYKERLWLTDETADTTGKEDTNLQSLSNIPEGALQAAPRPDDLTVEPSGKPGQVGALLDAIGNAEGASYTTMFGYAERGNGAFAGTDVTKMTVNEVRQLQDKMVASNGISSAIGKYQFIRATLDDAIKGLGLSGDELFDKATQDKLAIWLLKNRTDFDQWLVGEADPKKFQRQLASQWASVPDLTGKSAYAYDGVNNASQGGRDLIGLL
jgi:hypothetical protein